jgi:hypothetical protein
MLRMCVLAVFTGTDSSAAILCRGRFAGRYRSTFRGDQLVRSRRAGTRSLPQGWVPSSVPAPDVPSPAQSSRYRSCVSPVSGARITRIR